MESNYRITDRPAGTAFVAHDCRRCDAPELKRPVFLTDGTGIIAVGTRCAAIMLGLVDAGATTRAADKAITAHRADLARTAAATDDALWRRFLTETGMSPGLKAMSAFNEWKATAA